ncbi:cell division protein FtsL [Bacillus kexueae]|uniref:cell division protein FtsL n=1 Tax=Aeribacillus kexueae TaxID=2078952 RepID=UPI001FB0221A|nr:cell division protein FtsL [Bacillus kexueae]
MSNLAVKIQERKQNEQSKQVQQKVVVQKRPLFTLGEKMLFGMFMMIVVFGAVFILSNQVKLYEVNKDIQALEAKVNEQQKVNNDLLIQQDELSNPERIWAKAKELGLTLNPNNVKGVQD